MWNRGGNELPQSKPDGFASSLGEGASGVPPTSVLALSVTCGASSPKGRASGETGDFAIYPITFPPCQGPHLRGGCLRSRLGEFWQIPPQALPNQLPQRGSQAVNLDAKVLGTTRKLPAVLLALPLVELSPQVTERAHAVSPVTNVSKVTRNFPATTKSRPLGEGGIAVGDDGRGDLRSGALCTSARNSPAMPRALPLGELARSA